MFLDRSYGVEIECLPRVGTRNQNDGMAGVAAALRAAGVEVHVQHSHRGTAASGWTVKPDGSVSGGGVNGFEVVSPPMIGTDGFDQIDRVCAVLNDVGCHVNASCGLHVHVERPATNTCRRLAFDYATFESVIDSFMPIARRGDRSGYAKSITKAQDFRRVAGTRDIHDLVRLIVVNETPKYRKINFARWHQGTVEFRHHSGTTNAIKINNWVKFCLRMVERAATNPIEFSPGAAPAEAVGARRRARHRLGRRRRMFVSLITRVDGVTRDEIFAATGWASGSLSMIRFARESGITLRRQRLFNGSFRYYGVFASEAAVAAMPSREDQLPEMVGEPVVAATLERLFFLLGVDDSEKNYWTARVEHHNQVIAGAGLVGEAAL